mmetsp:Transcript_21974/g.39922  ORF Transcript_21974/g.39922 Transcript_21974/m.39922 type:complete len:347 (+) Transcript_21974:13-1053(+)
MAVPRSLAIRKPEENVWPEASPKAILARPTTAQRTFICALEKDLCNHAALCNLAATLQRHELVKLADGKEYSKQDLCLKAIQLEPTHAASYENLASCFNLHEKVHVQGTEWNKQMLLMRALELDPCNAHALNNLAATLSRQDTVTFLDGRAYDAIGLYKRALELRPKMAEAYANLGACLYPEEKVQIGDGLEVDKQMLLLEALRLDSNLAQAYTNMAETLSLDPQVTVRLPNGLRWGKQELHLKAIELDPYIPAAWRGLADTLNPRGEEPIGEGRGVSLNGFMWTRRQLQARALILERKAWKGHDHLTKERWASHHINMLPTTVSHAEPNAARPACTIRSPRRELA